MFQDFIILVSAFHVLSIQFIRYPFHSHLTFVILGLKNSSVSRLNFVALLSFVKVSNTPLRLFEELLISTEKLVSELLSGIIWALRNLSYRILLFICSVLIRPANDAFITVSNSRLMLEIVHVTLGFDALITSE